ncbi:bZIP transcription factor 50-like [Rutidosis leptorrhynchoides]|uniref:bZIP transcription factor 50-like n=1 Tax=Rutidosis leptorrhynchoides TaxID=125765 RepID=UPI003A9A10F3
MELEEQIDFNDLINFDTIFLSDDQNSDHSSSILQTSSHSSSPQNHVNNQSPLSVDDIEQFFMNDEDDEFPHGSVLDEFIRENLLDKSGEVVNISDDLVGHPNGVVDYNEETNSDDDRKRQQRTTDAALSSQESENLDLDGFINDLLVDSPLEGGKSSEVDLSDDSADDQKNSHQHEAAVVDHKEEKQTSSENDDPLDKKRKRQLRNKDAALKSRERKKMYVKDLEMKSRFYEGECRRLGSLLQCYMAENQALRFSLHSNNKAFNASMTKQESAVLFLESLLLGSLLWLISMVCQLVVLPSLHQQSQQVTGVEEKLPKPVPRKEGSEMCRQTLLMGKQFKASRSRMRQNLRSLQVVRNMVAVF